MKKELSKAGFIKEVCSKLNIAPIVTIETTGENIISSQILRLKDTKITVFKDGNLIPLYTPNTRKLNPAARTADKIICEVKKTLSDIKKEAGGNIKSKNCKIHGTGGWYENGTEYSFEDIYCEV